MANSNNINRRDFFRKSSALGLTAALGGSILAGKSRAALPSIPPAGFNSKPIDLVRIGFIGAGGMGSNHIRNLMNIEGCEIRAICDIVPEKVARVQKWHRDANKPVPAGYSKGEHDYKRMCAREDLDLVYIATPWRWHVPMCVEAMNAGKHAAVEVPAAVTLDECWQLVETSEKTKRHCSMMENCNYDRVEMMVLNMVKQNLFGELLHAKCGYLHDLRDQAFSKGGEGLWRPAHNLTRNGDLYPTHGLAPVAQCMDINRGNNFDYIVSVASKSRAVNDLAARRFGPDSPHTRTNWKLGDVVTSTIRTKNGETIVVTHDVTTPRPYSRDYFVQGTRGLVRKYPEARVHIEGTSPAHGWEPLSKYFDKYDHPVWKAMQQKASGAAGHGSMDYIEDYRLVQAYRKGITPDMDVYDAAALSAVSQLSERSIENKGESVNFPDFTRGMWRKPRELQVQKDA
ncbi:Glycosyl hydrolase family 109 protein 1 precursor [Anaerohalosphaera lusitana]|uniref:Glycosyl hydrolase family 109 protein 1 n=1 Tax=Anaerohalosphaera lusitana TaxID=1936003 RepID=A0A1U9NJK5_9BACT|nr:Gfo/Idh/MocA family oxidoreductase [Anaerohalosphaera lusitana]AQT67987.1 Glycosyl hydrolase family 109 protein 1 precursor [Anaerohalosphaera lusitana]